MSAIDSIFSDRFFREILKGSRPDHPLHKNFTPSLDQQRKSRTVLGNPDVSKRLKSLCLIMVTLMYARKRRETLA